MKNLRQLQKATGQKHFFFKPESEMIRNHFRAWAIDPYREQNIVGSYSEYGTTTKKQEI